MTLEAFNSSDEFLVGFAAASLAAPAFHTGEIALGPLAELLIFQDMANNAGSSIPIQYDHAQGALLKRGLRSVDAGYVSNSGMGVLRFPGILNDQNALRLNTYILGFRQALSNVQMPSTAVQTLLGVVGEMIDNVGIHAGESRLSFTAFDVQQKSVWVTIADAGEGVMRSYTQNPLAPKPIDAQEALQWAVVDHRSSTGDPARGLGYRRAQIALRSLDASMRVRSDDACIETRGGANLDDWLLREQVSLRGFIVSIHIGW